MTLPSVRVGAGASFADTEDDQVASIGQLSAGVRTYRIGTAGPFAEAGLDYSYTDNITSQHCLALGAGVGYRLAIIGIAFTPRLVMGLSELAVGARPGISFDFLSLAYLEVAYQYLPADRGTDHSLRLTAGIDLGLFLYILATPPDRRRPM